MRIAYIGIDPSLNSTGITILLYNNNTMESKRFFIVKPNKLTRKEKEASEKYSNIFEYVLYEKTDINIYKDDNHLFEYHKTLNFINCIDTIYNTISNYLTNSGIDSIYNKKEDSLLVLPSNGIYNKNDNLLVLPSNGIYNKKEDSLSNSIDKIYITIEGISYGSSIRTKSVFDLAGLNYMIRYKFISDGYPVYIATPANVKKFATGKGNANKDLILSVFNVLFPDLDIPKKDDIADSYFLANLCLNLQTQYGQNNYASYP